MSVVVTEHKLKYEGKTVGYRINVGGCFYDVDTSLFKELASRFSKRKSDIEPAIGEDIELFVCGDCLVSKDDNALEVGNIKELASIFASFGIELFKICVVDTTTYETVIRTDDKKEAKSAIKDWQKNNPDCLIAIYEDGECVYP